MAAEKTRITAGGADDAEGTGMSRENEKLEGTNGVAGEGGDAPEEINGAAGEGRSTAEEVNGAVDKRSNASGATNGAAEKTIGSGSGSGGDPHPAASDTDGHGRSAPSTMNGLHDLLQAVDDEEAREAMAFRLFWSTSNPYFGTFEETTYLLPKCFTSGPVPRNAISVDTAQVFSVTVREIKQELGIHWPIEVYGLVAARDNVDFRRRNIIFSRDRNNCQMLTAEDSSLVLTGPSRAVISESPIIFEINLKVKGGKESEDRVLSYLVIDHDGVCGMHTYGKLYREIRSNKQSTTELMFAQLENSVEATIDIKVVDGSWSNFCPRFVARTKSFPDVDFVLFDPRGGAMLLSDEGMIKLSRSVVTVESDGELELTAEAREHGSSTVVASNTVRFTPKRIGTTHEDLNLGFCKMEVCVFWSLLAAYY